MYITLTKKEIFLNGEGNAWYKRNLEKIHFQGDVMPVTKILEKYMQDNNLKGSKCKLLEIGCSWGYNLAYLSKKLGILCYGIEPSLEAVDYGMDIFKQEKLNLIQGTSDFLPYDDNSFDIVVLGFCLFWVDRKYLFKSIAEADRVLKEKGTMVVIDFDTNIAYKRNNIHNQEAVTYKMQYSKLFLANPQYYLIKKETYSHADMKFTPDIQERVALNILYKEDINSAYIFSEDLREEGGSC